MLQLLHLSLFLTCETLQDGLSSNGEPDFENEIIMETEDKVVSLKPMAFGRIEKRNIPKPDAPEIAPRKKTQNLNRRQRFHSRGRGYFGKRFGSLYGIAESSGGWTRE
jgi:hypothetical protein